LRRGIHAQQTGHKAPGYREIGLMFRDFGYWVTLRISSPVWLYRSSAATHTRNPETSANTVLNTPEP